MQAAQARFFSDLARFSQDLKVKNDRRSSAFLHKVDADAVLEWNRFKEELRANEQLMTKAQKRARSEQFEVELEREKTIKCDQFAKELRDRTYEKFMRWLAENQP